MQQQLFRCEKHCTTFVAAKNDISCSAYIIIKPKVGAKEVLYNLPTPYYIEETYMGQRK
jgi:hypothetical protein